jgi:uncharacterized phiE125 gp8 family phage protein
VHIINYIIKTAPTVEPVSLAEAQAHCRSIDDTAENATLTALIIAAREYCEQYTRRALAPQTIELYLDYFSTDIYLPLPPVTAVTSIIYTDYLGVATTVSASDYIVDLINNRIIPAYDKTWPAFTPYATNPIKITYVAGYTAATVPKAVKQAILLLVGHWYINREATGTADKPIEFSVKNLLTLHKSGWF